MAGTKSVFKLSRRRVLIGAAGAAVAVGGAGLWLGVRRLRGERFRRAVARGDGYAPSVYLAVLPDGAVNIWLIRSEMGQGVRTALPMLIAEELDADWASVRVEQAVAGDGFDYGSMLTVASASISSQWIELRRAGAVAREMLTAAAAAQWGVPASACVTRSGRVLHPASGRAAGYGELAEAASRRRVPIRPRLKDPSEFRLIGHGVARVGAADLVQGTARYGIDVRVPGMLRAVIARSPVVGGRPAGLREAAALAVPGVRAVFEVSSGIAVLADDTHSAFRGRRALDITWQSPPEHRIDDADVSRRLRDVLDGPVAAVARSDGDADAVLGAGSDLLDATYELPYLAHACMEPMNCTAEIADGRCRLWAPTQDPDGARRVAAEVAGLPLHAVTVETTLMGGGFGRRTGLDVIQEAVEVARQARAPVQLVWSREDDLAHGEYREASMHRLQAALGDDGVPRAWRHRVVTATPSLPPPGEVSFSGVMGAEDMPYDVPHVHVEWQGCRLPLPTRIWRSVGHSYNGFAVECFIDELAHAAGEDPLAYRRRLLSRHPRLARCLDRVAAMAGWDADGGAGRALGVSAVRCMGSYVAQVVEVGQAASGRLNARRVWCAVDCGIVVNPSAARAQIEGGILFGLSAALYGGMRLEGGRIVDDNFHRHRLLRGFEAPQIAVAFLPSAEAPSGVGEVSVPGIAPALANALFRAIGERVRRLPLHG